MEGEYSSDDSSDFDHEEAQKKFLQFLTDHGSADVENFKRIMSPPTPPAEICNANKEPLKNITPRFQLFTGFLYFEKLSKRKPVNLFGHVKIFNPSSEEEGDKLDDPDCGVSIIFGCPFDKPRHFVNKNMLFPPSPPIPVYTSLHIGVDLHTVTHDNLFLQLTNDPNDYKLTVEKYDTFCKHQIKGRDGYLDILTNPIDAAFEMTFHPNYHVQEKLFNVTIHAFFGDNTYGDNTYGPFLLLDVVFTTLLENCKIPLNTSLLSVPAKGYDLVFRAMVRQITGEDSDSDRAMYFDQNFILTPKVKGSSNVCIEGENCSIKVNVNWKYEGDTDENDVAADEIHTLKEGEELETCDELDVEVQAEIQNDEETVFMQTNGTGMIQKKNRKKKKAKKKKVADEIHTLKECEKLDIEDEEAVRKKILKNIIKLRRKKHRMSRMAVNGKYTEDDELELELKSLQLSLCKLKVATG